MNENEPRFQPTHTRRVINECSQPTKCFLVRKMKCLREQRSWSKIPAAGASSGHTPLPSTLHPLTTRSMFVQPILQSSTRTRCKFVGFDVKTDVYTYAAMVYTNIGVRISSEAHFSPNNPASPLSLFILSCQSLLDQLVPFVLCSSLEPLNHLYSIGSGTK